VIIDAAKFDFADARTDVCIVGGGAAGLTLAAALADLEIQILVLEAGGSSPADWSDDILKGDALGNHPPPQSHRVCALGGTSVVTLTLVSLGPPFRGFGRPTWTR
jgi:choline dehydrogenase-like flavoprotein